jgi:dCTP deaminase
MVRECAMIEPFSPRQVREAVAYGLSSYGYDVRLAREFLVPRGTSEIDPNKVKQSDFQSLAADSLLVRRGSFVLGRTVEYLRIPRNALGLCFGKSTYARCGLVVNVTPLEPEWEGHVTLSLVNAGPLAVRLHAGEGIAQVVFLLGERACAVSYRDRKGRYQAQRHVTVARGTQGEQVNPDGD